MSTGGSSGSPLGGIAATIWALRVVIVSAGSDAMAEPEGFREFVAARSAALVRSALLLTGDEAMAQDVVQTALVKAWLRWAGVTGQDAPEAYVRRVMVSTFLTWNRRRWHGEQAVAAVPERPGVRDEFADADLRGCVSSALS